MTKSIPSFLAGLCAAVLFTFGSADQAYASANLLDPIRIWGPVTGTEAGSEDVKFLSIDNQSGQSFDGELQITVSNVYTRVLDAVTGLPYPYENIRSGDTAYVYIGPAMTMSLTPMANASLILCNIPADYKVPDYLKVESLSWNAAKTQAVLTATSGQKYTIPASCETTPYLSANIVTVDDLTPGSSCLVWSDQQNTASRIINFSNPGVPIDELPMEPGWHKLNNSWYFYKEDGAMAKGWLAEGGKQYYMDPDTGSMRTGFLVLDGNVYYLQNDGSLLTSPKTFTPDRNGILH